VKKRVAVSKKIQLQLLATCGYKCSVPRCSVTESLEFHHINRNPKDNRSENLIVFCAVHHHLADTGKISAKACRIMKQMLPNLDGLGLAAHKDLSLSKDEFSLLIDVARVISKESLRVITEQFISYLMGKNEGYQCRDGIEPHDFLVSEKLLYCANDKVVPALWKISEKGILFCRFLYNSQYFLPFVAFDQNYPKSEIIKWNFEKLPFRKK
jgi:hypothetical protein